MMRSLWLRRPARPTPPRGRVEVVPGLHQRLRQAQLSRRAITRPLIILVDRLLKPDGSGVPHDTDEERGKDAEGESVGDCEVQQEFREGVEEDVVVLHEQDE